MSTATHQHTTLFTLSAILLCLIFANIFCGSIHIPFQSIIDILLGKEISGHPAWTYIILHSRIPQLITSAFAGMSLAICGLLLQTTFRNPLAGPSILGIDSGASLGVAICMLLFGGNISLGGASFGGTMVCIIAAMFGSIAIMLLLTALNALLRNTIMLLITGVIISYITSSIISLLQFWANHDGLQSYVMWGMGSFSGVSTEQLPIFITTLGFGLLMAFLLIKPLDALLLGDKYAENLGVNTTRTRHLLLLCTGILTAVCTAFCGPISFIGLATPHLARFISKSGSHRALLPMSLLLGASISLLCNLLCNIPQYNVLPINVLTPLIGAPVVIYHTLSPVLGNKRWCFKNKRK